MNNNNVLNILWSWFDSHALSGLSLKPFRVQWIRIIPFIVLHLACFGVFWVGWSWAAVVVAVLMYAIRMFAITGFYHRYFSHRSFKTSRIGQFLFALLGATATQRGALWWASHHRTHHRDPDGPGDVHSPHRDGFWWSHCLWFTCDAHFQTDYSKIKDLAKYPELVFLNRFDVLVPICFALGLLGLGSMLNLYWPQLGTSGLQILAWGYFISTTVLAHATFTINSLSHKWGTRDYDTQDQSRNNFFLAMLTFGEGWHNNHHRFPGSVRQGLKWWQIDLTYYGLVVMERVGLIWKLNPPPSHSRRVRP